MTKVRCDDVNMTISKREVLCDAAFVSDHFTHGAFGDFGSAHVREVTE